MVDVRGLLADRPGNAIVAWLSIGGLAVAGLRLLLAGNVLWPTFALVAIGVAVLPSVLERDLLTTMPGELVALVAIPVITRALGILPQLTIFVAVAGLALLVVIVFDGFTSLEMAPRFAVGFVAITTMAFAGGLAITAFGADALLGTDFIGGQRDLNLDLLTATIVGVLAGVVLEAYFRKTDGTAPLPRGLPFTAVQSTTTAPPDSPHEGEGSPGFDGRDEGAEPADSMEDGVTGSPRYRLAIRGLQLVLVGIVGLSIVTVNGKLFVNSAVPLALTFLPWVARRRYGYPMHATLALLVAFAATVHAVGALGPYSSTAWYDTITHALSSTLVAGVGYALAHGLELHTDRVSFSARFRGVFIVVFVLAVGVLWELLEFGSGLAAAFFGAEVLAQYGVDDIVKDLAFNVVGAVLVAVWGTDLFERPARAIAGRVGGMLR